MTTYKLKGLIVEEEGTMMTLKSFNIPTHLESTKKCLIGKLFTDKPQLHAAITSELYGMWNKPKGFICEELEDRIYRFYFDKEFDARSKLRRQPWNYKGQLLVLKPWQKGKNPLSYKFDHVPFKVQFWGLPLDLCTPIVVKNLCSHAGFALEAEVYNNNRYGYKSIPRFVVLMDVSKPLQLGASLDIDGYENIWVDFKYEKLPMYCYYCGKIGHEKERCLELLKDSIKGDADSCKYGPDLVAGARIGKTIEKQDHHQNQHLMKDKTMVENVSQQLQSLSFSQEHHENVSQKRRNEETYEDRKGKRVCSD